MRKTLFYCRLVPFLLVACGRTVDDSAITNPTAKETVEDLKREIEAEENSPGLDTLTEEVQEQKVADKQKQLETTVEGMNRSPLKDKTPEQIAVMLNERVVAFEQSCDTAVVNQLLRDLNRDAILTQWRDKHEAERDSLSVRLKAAKKRCKDASL